MLKEVFAVINRMETVGVVERYALGGAVAATFYIEPIATIDVDCFVAFRAEPGSLLISTRPIFEHLIASGFAVDGEYIIIADWPVQFLPTTGPLVEEALNTAESVDLEGVNVRVFSAEHLAAIALETARPKDHARLVQFVEAGVLDPARFEAILQRHGLLATWLVFQRTFFGEKP